MNWHARFELTAGWQDDDAVFATEGEAMQYAASEAVERNARAFGVVETDRPRNAFVAHGFLMRVRMPR